MPLEVEVLERIRFERFRQEHTGGVDEQVQASDHPHSALVRSPMRAPGALRSRQIVAATAGRGVRLLETLEVASDDRDARARLGEGERDAAADPRARAGDDGALSLQARERTRHGFVPSGRAQDRSYGCSHVVGSRQHSVFEDAAEWERHVRHRHPVVPQAG